MTPEAVDAVEADTRARRLALPGTYNVRDLGGYAASGSERIRAGLLLRGDSLHRVGPAGIAMLAALPLRTVIDLRDGGERAAYPTQLGGLAVKTHRIPLLAENGQQPSEENWTLLVSYLEVIRTRGLQFAAVARALAAPGALPALFHCMAGKDRTGLVAAILLSALGVDDASVTQDFAASQVFLDDDYHREATARTLSRGIPRALVEQMLLTDPGHIRAVLSEIRTTYGGAARYLHQHGLGDGELASLRTALVQPAGER